MSANEMNKPGSNNQDRKPVWRIRIEAKGCLWSALQAADNEAQAWELYLNGYEQANMDVSEYRCIEVWRAPQKDEEHYYSDDGN